MFSHYTRTCVFLFAPVFLFATDRPATISGTVTDSSGASVPDAVIYLHQLAGSALITTNSDALGNYTFAGVSAGKYLLDVSAPGLTLSQPVNLSIEGGESRQLDLHLIVGAVRSQVTVTAAGQPQSVDQVSKELNVVNVADVEQQGLFSVPDALRYLPGLRVSARGGPGQFTEIQTRGLRYIDTSVLFDGFRFRDPTAPQADASAFLGQLFLTDSSRIELLQGSGSSLYGTNSMGGTINIITNEGGGPVHGDVDLQGGGLGLFHGVARLAGGAFANRLSYSAGLSNLNVSSGVDKVEAARDWSGQGQITYALTAKIRVSALLLGNTGYTQTPVSPQPTATAPVSGIIPAVPLSTDADSSRRPEPCV